MLKHCLPLSLHIQYMFFKYRTFSNINHSTVIRTRTLNIDIIFVTSSGSFYWRVVTGTSCTHCYKRVISSSPVQQTKIGNTCPVYFYVHLHIYKKKSLNLHWSFSYSSVSRSSLLFFFKQIYNSLPSSEKPAFCHLLLFFFFNLLKLRI